MMNNVNFYVQKCQAGFALVSIILFFLSLKRLRNWTLITAKIALDCRKKCLHYSSLINYAHYYLCFEQEELTDDTNRRLTYFNKNNIFFLLLFSLLLLLLLLIKHRNFLKLNTEENLDTKKIKYLQYTLRKIKYNFFRTIHMFTAQTVDSV